MTIWAVGVSDCESNYTVALCLTKDIAERELFKIRDNLVKKWQEMSNYLKKQYNTEDAMYLKMIENLSSNDYTQWKNFPHEEPYIHEEVVITE